jgi:hypothetical protein
MKTRKQRRLIAPTGKRKARRAPYNSLMSASDRVELYRLTIVGDGAVEFALLVVREAAIGIGLGKIRVKPDRLVVVGDSAVSVALVVISGTAVVVGVGIFRGEPDCLVGRR